MFEPIHRRCSGVPGDGWCGEPATAVVREADGLEWFACANHRAPRDGAEVEELSAWFARHDLPDPNAITLSGEHVRLEPLSLDHVDALAAAASDARETCALTFVPDGAAAMRRYIEEALAGQAAGMMLPFVTIDARAGRVVGSTRFCWIERWTWPGPRPADAMPGAPDAAEIGWTWLVPAAQRTGINTEQKLLMLTHAFETWRARRISFITDARNIRSRAALERIGARFDGLRRAHFPAADNTIRDSALFSILLAEWGETRARLQRLLRR